MPITFIENTYYNTVWLNVLSHSELIGIGSRQKLRSFVNNNLLRNSLYIYLKNSQISFVSANYVRIMVLTVK